jgi:hypothetical protein
MIESRSKESNTTAFVVGLFANIGKFMSVTKL